MKTIFTLIIAVIGSLTVWAQDKGFVHTATAENTGGHVTHIDNAELNGNPAAYFLYSQRYNGSNNDNPTGIWYDISVSKWAIYNENLDPMPVGMQFNIYIPDDSEVEVVVNPNSSTHQLPLVGYLQGSYVFHNNYYNPNAVYNPYIYGNYFVAAGVDERRIYEEGLNSIPNGAGFIVMKGLDVSSSRHTQTSNASNIDGNSMILDNPSLNDNPDAIFIFSHYWGYPDVVNQVYLPYVTEVEYASGHWRIYAYGSGGFPENVTIDYIIPDETMGTNDAAAQISKVSIYPNPSIDIVNFKSSIKPIQSVEIYDFTGKLIQSTVGNDTTISMNVSAIPSGVYIAKITTDEGTFSQKLVKK